MAQRDPKTGRFLPKGEEAKQDAKPVMGIGERMNMVLKNAAEVFIRKDLAGNPVKMNPGSEVIVERVAKALFRVKRVNSPRTYYTKKLEA